MRIYDIIQKKRGGGQLTGEEIRFAVSGAVSGEIPDYQLSALLMAIWFQGMTLEETAALTMAMAGSGEKADLSGIPGLKIDKHSTGGVGDKTTLAAVPIAAACGLPCAKMSGRGLGHTGGTADKLEAIPGFRTILTQEEFFRTVQETGMSLITQTGNIAPADKKLYALRDVTATVDSLPLIASSIMSKKLASGCDGVVLDVKVGSGAFMKTQEEAEALAQAMVSVGKAAGMRVSALITDMDVPLGRAVGNALEVEEALDCLKGRGPNDLRELSLALAGEMLVLGEKGNRESCMAMAQEALDSGRALAVFRRMVKAQGGDEAALDRPFPRGSCHMVLKAEEDGYLIAMDTREIGSVSVMLGAGRAKTGDEIDLSAGMRILAKTGDFLQKDQPLAELYASQAELLAPAAERYRCALTFGLKKPQDRKLIFTRIGG